MKKLESTLIDLAQAFAAQVVDAVKHASLADLRAATSGTKATKATKASVVNRAADRTSGTDTIVKLLQTRRAGMRATEIRSELGLTQKEIAPLVIEGLRAKKLVKTGVRRGTLYFAR